MSFLYDYSYTCSYMYFSYTELISVLFFFILGSLFISFKTAIGNVAIPKLCSEIPYITVGFTVTSVPIFRMLCWPLLFIFKGY